MKAIALEIEINAPIEQVFAIFTDIQRWPEMIQSMAKIELLTAGPVGRGTRFRETRLLFNKEAHEDMEFTEFQPPNRYVIEASSHSTHYISTFTFRKNDDGATSLRMTFVGKPQTLIAKTVGSFLFFFFAGMTRKTLAADLNAIKTTIEQDC